MEQKNWLQRLQESDESRKRRWLVGLALLSMVIVVFVWLSYFNSLLSCANQVVAVASAERNTNVSFFETMKTGTAVITDHLWSAVRRLGRILNAPKNYIIKP